MSAMDRIIPAIAEWAHDKGYTTGYQEAIRVLGRMEPTTGPKTDNPKAEQEVTWTPGPEAPTFQEAEANDANEVRAYDEGFEAALDQAVSMIQQNLSYLTRAYHDGTLIEVLREQAETLKINNARSPL